MRHRRPAQCRQVDPVQRADADRGGPGRQLSLLHHRAQCRRRRGAGCSASTTLAKIAGSKEIIPTRLTFVDIAGLVRGASKGEGLGNQFLANIRECDAIAHVVRCFEDGDITHVEGGVDPIRDIETIETELMLADLESLEKRVVNLEKKAQGRRQGSQGTARSCQPLPGRCCARASRRAWRRSPPTSARPSPSSACCRPSPCSMSAMSRKPPPTMATRFPQQVSARAARGGRGGGGGLGQDRKRDRGHAGRGPEGFSRSRRARRSPASTA